MKKAFLAITLFNIYFNAVGQNDTIIKKDQKGYLFLTSYNFQYDWNGIGINSVGFHDFFFPSECIDIKCILDSNLSLAFKNGVRVDYIFERKPLKAKAYRFSSIDTSECYTYNKFYILPVIIDYKEFEDYHPFICYRNYYEMQIVNGSHVRFEYLHRGIKPTKITPLVPTKNKSKIK